jgi:AbrB family looped-hinge helix DNA binding protein
MRSETVTLGSRGTLVVPQSIRKALGLNDGALLIVEVRDGAIVARPAIAVPVERYTKERQAEFLLSDAIDEASYANARKLVQHMGLNPDRIPHERPDSRPSVP